MRIRKRYRSPLPPPDLSSPFPSSTAAAAAVGAPPVVAARGATGGKEGEPMAAAAAAGAAAASVSGSRCGGGTGLHPSGCATNPTPCAPFYTPAAAAAAAAAGEGERGDLPARGPPLPTTRDVLFYHGHGGEVPKQQQDGENGGDIGDAYSGDNAPASKSLGAKAAQISVGHGGHEVPSYGAAAALAMVRWSGEEGKLSLKKKRGGYHAARGRSLGLGGKGEENVAAEGEMKQPSPITSRRRRAAVANTTTMVATAGNVLTSAGTGNMGSAPTATGDNAGAAKRYCDDVVVKEEGGDVVVPAATAALVDGNRSGGNGNGNGNGKKRRSPAVLMEGSRCSRVNGRGWRCCQQTLVGYSLCEHHLGKGRLRSVSSVRCNGRARKKEDVDGTALPPAPSLPQQQDQLLSGDGEDGEDEEEEKPGKRRRNKIGMVKARSISSLLHQPAAHPIVPATIAAPEPFTSPSPAPATRPVTAAAPPAYGAGTAHAVA